MSSALTEAVRSFPIPPPNKGHICQFHNSLSWLSLLDLGVAKIRLFHILPKLFFIGAALRCYNCRPWRDLRPRLHNCPWEQEQPEIESVLCRFVAKSHLLPPGVFRCYLPFRSLLSWPCRSPCHFCNAPVGIRHNYRRLPVSFVCRSACRSACCSVC